MSSITKLAEISETEIRDVIESYFSILGHARADKWTKDGWTDWFDTQIERIIAILCARSARFNHLGMRYVSIMRLIRRVVIILSVLTLLLFVGVFASFLVYTQGTKLWPSFKDHPFHNVRLDKAAGSPDYGVKPFVADEGTLSVPHKMLYLWALAKFPTMSSCLIADEDEEITEMHWAQIKTPQQLQVCLFNVANKAGGATQYHQWLQDYDLPNRTQFVDYTKHNASLGYIEAFGQPRVPQRDFIIVSFSKRDRDTIREANPDAAYIAPHMIALSGMDVYMSFDDAGRVEYIKQESHGK